MRRMLVGIYCLMASHWVSADPRDFAIDIRGTSLSELMNLKITSLSRKQENLNKAPAAVYVLTQDHIQRMGVTHIAEALRYVPGVEVARLSASQWAISIRGFNSRTANKLLVMIDGRSIYSPLYAGVLWEEKDVFLPDVERIEVIRGPGGTQWGANAVNGVINIITKDAKSTLGGTATVGAGLEESGLGRTRYGWRIDENTFARVYAKYVRRDESGSGRLLPGEDYSRQAQTGFRVDRHLESQQFTLQGDLYRGSIGPEFAFEGSTTREEEFNGGNLRFNWTSQVTRDRKHEFQVYFDETSLFTSLIDRRKVWNADYQMQQLWRNHEFVGGVGYKRLSDNIEGSPAFYMDPSNRTDEITSAFIQDDIALLNDRLHLIAGTKYEHNNYSGEEWQPSIRSSYSFVDAVIWAAVSRAVRTPTRLEHDVVLPSIVGNQTLTPEYATFYEFGYRKSWNEDWQFDVATYLGKYDDLLTVERNLVGNEMDGDVHGVELTVAYQPHRTWLLRLNYTHAEMDLSVSADSLDSSRALTTMGSHPKNMLQLISLWDISPRWQLNTYLRFVDELDALGVSDYWVGDLSIAWLPAEETRVQLVGRHLGRDQHHEWGPANNAVEPDWAIYLTQEF